jgi:hypothetical protein
MIFDAALNGGGLVVCGWCRRWLRVNRELPAGAVSHGLCPECETRTRRELDEILPPAADHAPVHPATHSAGFGAASPARLPVAFSTGGSFQPEVHHV